VYTIKNLFKFLHVLAVIVWVGGVLTVNLLQILSGRGHDRAAQGALLRLSDLYGRAVIAPAAAQGDPRWAALQRRAATLYAVNLLLLSALWAMEYKPTF
jgi:hypothetical protein